MKFLEALAGYQCRKPYFFIGVTVLLLVMLGAGIANTRLQTDLSKEMPQDIPSNRMQNRVSEIFGGEDTLLVLVYLDRECSLDGAPKDIRDPKVIRVLMDSEEVISKESGVRSVRSVGDVFGAMGGVPSTTEGVRTVLESVPSSGRFFNPDYSATFILVSATVGSGEEKVNSFVSKINEDLESVPSPACVRMVVTGSPPLRSIILETLKSDLVVTLGLASVLIFLLVFAMKRSLESAVLVVSPLAIGLLWTLGIAGWLGLAFSIATAGLGAMILGLGTEYGIFLLERYREERLRGLGREKSMKIALPSVGSSIIGSGMTTIIGFMALLIAPMPMIQNLGKMLALGIFCILVATVFSGPSIIIAVEDISDKLRGKLAGQGGEAK
ncbi:MAG: MMPL family transporter [Candidatus Aenigmarchaeota archaeon]|nr:MMPL family transporter [Candidatus Aenigmarchaeota archaeon]